MNRAVNNDTITICFDNLSCENGGLKIKYPETAEPLPSGYPVDGSMDFNARIAELSEATGTEIGPSIVLPVRRGDKISLSTRYFYEEVGEGTTYENMNMLVNEILMSLATGGAGVLRLNESQLIDIAAGNGNYANDILNLLSNSFDTTDVSKPHSYMVWMLYDNNMKLIPEGSGARRVRNPNQLGTLIEEAIPAETDGYLHCFVSNEGIAPVNFDNFLVTYLQGQTRQINHYYPYGLSISGIDGDYDDYLNKYTSKELQTGEFGSLASSSGLEMFDFHARFYDPQVGKWFTPDPAEQFHNPYLAMGNNPVVYVDPDGESIVALIAAAGIVAGSFLQASTGNDDFEQLFIGGAIGGAAALSGYGAGVAMAGVAGAGFIGGAASGAAGGFASGFVGASHSTWYNGGDFHDGMIAGFKSGGIGAVTGAITGGVLGGISAKKAGLDFWTGKFKSADDALKYFNNLLASKSDYIGPNELMPIDLGSESIHKEIRRVFSYLEKNGVGGYNIEDLVDFNTQFDKPLWKKISDGFFNGGLGKMHNEYTIKFPKVNLAGKMEINVWTDRRIISGTFEYLTHGNNWHYLYLDSSTGSHMIGVGFEIRKLYHHFVYDFIGMHHSNVH